MRVTAGNQPTSDSRTKADVKRLVSTRTLQNTYEAPNQVGYFVYGLLVFRYRLHGREDHVNTRMYQANHLCTPATAKDEVKRSCMVIYAWCPQLLKHSFHQQLIQYRAMIVRQGATSFQKCSVQQILRQNLSKDHHPFRIPHDPSIFSYTHLVRGTSSLGHTPSACADRGAPLCKGTAGAAPVFEYHSMIQ